VTGETCTEPGAGDVTGDVGSEPGGGDVASKADMELGTDNVTDDVDTKPGARYAHMEGQFPQICFDPVQQLSPEDLKSSCEAEQ
jgi:hypothetical protein